MSVQFTSTKKEHKLIDEIVERAVKEKVLIRRRPSKFNEDKMTLRMDLDAINSNGTKLDFDKLLNFPEFDFMHDITGIQKHIDRLTGELRNHFLPRCYKKIQEA